MKEHFFSIKNNHNNIHKIFPQSGIWGAKEYIVCTTTLGVREKRKNMSGLIEKIRLST